MKKFLACVLAVVLTLSLGAVAFAEEVEAENTTAQKVLPTITTPMTSISKRWPLLAVMWIMPNCTLRTPCSGTR